MPAEKVKIIAKNSKAFHDYFIDDRFEAGIELAGTEVKSIRQGNLNLKDSYCIAKDGEIHIHGMHISPYEKGNIFNRDQGKVKQDGYALVPLSVYLKHSLVKVEIGLARGKKLYDKRAAAAVKDAKREMERALKTRNR